MRKTGRCQLPLALTTDPLAHGEVHVTLALSLRRDDDKCSVSRENGENGEQLGKNYHEKLFKELRVLSQTGEVLRRYHTCILCCGGPAYREAGDIFQWTHRAA